MVSNVGQGTLPSNQVGLLGVVVPSTLRIPRQRTTVAQVAVLPRRTAARPKVAVAATASVELASSSRIRRALLVLATFLSHLLGACVDAVNTCSRLRPVARSRKAVASTNVATAKLVVLRTTPPPVRRVLVPTVFKPKVGLA